jgi:drug/metabolite transporter (DMT)-like permease
LLSLGGALCSAIYLFPYKEAARHAPAQTLAFALLLVAASFSSLLSLWERRQPRTERSEPQRRVMWRTALLLSLLTVSGNFCGAQAVARLDPAVNSVLLRTEVVFVGVMGALLLGEAITPALALGASTALLGLTVMNWPLSVQSLSGALWCLGAAASFGSMQVLTRRVIGRISPASVNTRRLWLAVALLACVPGTLESALAGGPELWLYAAAAALFGPFAGRLLIMFSLRDLRAAESALLLLLAPVFAFVLGYLGWGRVPSALQTLGSAIILLGIALPLWVGALRSPKLTS